MGDIMSALRTPLYFRGPPRSDGPFTSCSLLRRVIVCFTATNMSFAGFVHYRRTLKATGAHAPATNFTENFNDCLNEAPNLFSHVPVQSTEAALCEWLGISPQLLLHHKIVFELSSYTLVTSLAAIILVKCQSVLVDAHCFAILDASWLISITNAPIPVCRSKVNPPIEPF